MSEKLIKNNSTQMELNIQTSSQEDSRASPLVSQANKKEQETIDISGLKCFESSKLSNQNSLLAKMSKALLTSKTAWSSRLCVLTWKVKDTKFKRSIFQLQVSVPRTGEKESGSLQLWATPNSMDHLPQRSPEALLRQATTTRKGRTRPANLREQVNPETVKMWPTPRAKEPGRTTKGYGRGLAELIEGKETIGTKEYVANSNTRLSNGTNEEIFSRGQTSNTSSTGGGDKDVENSRRTLQQGTVFQGENENEIRKGNADQSKRSSSSSEYDVANPSSEQSHSNDNGQEQREISQQEQIELGGRSGGTLWPSNWEFEPNVGRVANGIPGRVHRLKGLGNSIIPKIAEEIGKAIIGAYNGSR
jgi:site-specific DNA-cytosine methylase